MQPPTTTDQLSRRSPAFRYGLAIVVTLVAIAIRLSLQPIVGNKFPYAALILSVLITARYGGFGSALLSIAVGLFGAVFFLIDWSKRDTSDYLGLVVFFVISCSMAYVVSRFRFLALALAEQKEELQTTLQQLRETNTRNSAILETALDCIISIDHQGTIIEFNPAAELAFGYKRADVLGKAMSQLIIPPRYREAHHNGFEKYLRTGEGPLLNKRIEVSALRADGTEFPIELAITPILYHDRPPVFTAHLRDIENEQKLQQRRDARVAINQALATSLSSQNPLPDILRALSGILDWHTAAYWEIHRTENQIACHTLLLEDPDTMQDFAGSTHRLRFSPGEGLPGRIWASRAAQWITDLSEEANFPRKNDAASAGLKSAFGFPLLVENQVVGVIEFFTRQRQTPDADLLELMSTVGLQLGQLLERRRIEGSLRSSESRFAHFMNQLPGLAWIKDQNGRYVYANSAAMTAFQVTAERLYGKTDAEIFPSSTAAQFTSNDQQAASSSEGVSVVETLEDKNGELRHSLVSKFPMKGDKEGEYLIGGMAIDITERLNAEEALKESDRRKNEFMAMLGHELRNPLAPIRNALELLTQSVDEKTFDWAKDVISRQLQHIVRLVDDLLDISRIIRGKILLQLDNVELQPIIQHAIEEIQFDLNQKEHRFQVSIPAEKIWLRADAVRLTQILSNLLTNAIKYTDPQGTISLSVTKHGDRAEISVADSGVGVDQHLLETIFIPFTQLTSSIDRSSGGLGIGLALVRRLVELHGGTIRAHSAGKGKGSEFIFELPTIAAPPTPESEPWKPAAITPRRVLVVDDNRGSAITLSKLLEKFWGHTVECVYSGLDVFEKVKQYQPEIIFLDIGLPGLNGHEVAASLKADASLQNIVLVALTGYGQVEDRQRSADVGFSRHWIKPVSVTTLQTFFQEIDSRP